MVSRLIILYEPSYGTSFDNVMFGLSRFFKSYTVTCPDNTTKTVYRSLDHAFPLISKGVDLKMAGKLADLSSSQLAVGAELKTNVDALLYQIDHANKELLISLRAAYLVFQSDPCSKSDYLESQIDKIDNEQRRIRSFDMALQAFIEIAKSNKMEKTEISNMLSEILDRFDGSRRLSTAVSNELSSATRVAKTLLERSGDS